MALQYCTIVQILYSSIQSVCTRVPLYCSGSAVDLVWIGRTMSEQTFAELLFETDDVNHDRTDTSSSDSHHDELFGGGAPASECSEESRDQPLQPHCVPGQLTVSRLVWEIVRVSDACIREDQETQVKKLLEAFECLDIMSTPGIPHDLRSVHSNLLASERNRQLLKNSKDGQHQLWYRYHMHKGYENAIDLLQTSLRPGASTWHSARRRDILKAHPEVALLLRDDPLTSLAMVAIIGAHLWAARALGAHEASFGVVALAAAGFGGFCAFGFQALCHEA